MADATLGSILDFNTGIARIVHGSPAAVATLPERHQIAPSELAGVLQLARFVAADNIDAVVGRSLVPSVDSREVLLPERFEAVLRSAASVVGAAMERATGDEKRDLEGLAAVLRDHQELLHALNFARDMLIAG
jgi:hypothetical protein